MRAHTRICQQVVHKQINNPLANRAFSSRCVRLRVCVCARFNRDRLPICCGSHTLPPKTCRHNMQHICGVQVKTSPHLNEGNLMSQRTKHNVDRVLLMNMLQHGAHVRAHKHTYTSRKEATQRGRISYDKSSGKIWQTHVILFLVFCVCSLCRCRGFAAHRINVVGNTAYAK